jgi:hypothetical protein
MSKQTIGAGKVHKLRPDKEAKIEPLDGWSVQTKYGTLRLHDGTDCVRLQDVHSWMCSNGTPPKQAVYAVFGALLDAAGEVDSGDFENLDTLFALRLVNASAAPVPVFVRVNSCRWDSDPYKCECMKVVTVWQMHPVGPIEKEVFAQRFILPVALSKTRDVQFLKTAFPDLGHVHFEDGTPGGFIYAMGEGAARVWFGAVDIESDHLAAHDAKKSREADAKHQVRWPKDEALSTLLARLAMPVAVAHKLWGWGRVVPVEALTTPVIEATEAQAAPAKDAAPSVSKKVKEKDKSPDWTGAKLATRHKELKAAGVKGFAEQAAKEAGISVREASRRIKAHKEGGATANVADQLVVVGVKNKAA